MNGTGYQERQRRCVPGMGKGKGTVLGKRGRFLLLPGWGELPGL